MLYWSLWLIAFFSISFARSSTRTRRFSLLRKYDKINSPGEVRSIPSKGTFTPKGVTNSMFRVFILGSGGAVFSNVKTANAIYKSDPELFEYKKGEVDNTDYGDIIVQKRPSDEREYRAVKLKNGMKVLLISDKDATRAAAALAVHVGSFSDPRDIAGLAHFAEHMCFLGTKKYPKEDDFSKVSCMNSSLSIYIYILLCPVLSCPVLSCPVLSCPVLSCHVMSCSILFLSSRFSPISASKFLSSHGGTSNAYTDSEDTVYYFDCSTKFLEPALDRFAQVIYFSSSIPLRNLSSTKAVNV